jgi:hypothetical protein
MLSATLQADAVEERIAGCSSAAPATFVVMAVAPIRCIASALTTDMVFCRAAGFWLQTLAANRTPDHRTRNDAPYASNEHRYIVS